MSSDMTLHCESMFNRVSSSMIHYSVVYFPDPYNILVSASFGSNPVISVFDETKKIKEIKDFKDDINNIIKLSKSSFLACSSDCHIRGYSIINKKSGGKLDFEMFFCMKLENSSVQKMLKINDKEILVATYSSLVVLDIEAQKIVRRLNPIVTNGIWFGFILSKNDYNNFFISTGKYEIKLINSKSGKIVKSFDGTECKGNFYNLESYINSEHTEILIAGRSNCIIYFFNAKTGTILRKLNLGELTGKTHAVCALCFLVVRKKFLLVGKEWGGLSVFDIRPEKMSTELAKNGKKFEKLHPSHVYGMCVMDVSNFWIKFGSCSYDGTVRVHTLTSDLFSFSEKDIDESERIDYLKEFYLDNFELEFLNGKFQIGNLLLYFVQ